LLYGAILGVAGFFFAAVAALFAQLSSTARGASGCAFAVLGAAYLLRAVGDVQAEPLALISPLGLIERARVYADNEIFPVAILALASVAIWLIAFGLNAIRDRGMGLFPARRGRTHAPRTLSGPWGLAFRLLRSAMIAWSVVVLTLAASYGSVFGDMTSFYEGNDVFQAVMGISGATPDDLIESIIGTLMMIMSLISAIPAVMAVLRLRSEEKRGRLEQIYGKAVSKPSNMAAYASLSFLLTLVLQLLTACGLWLAARSVMDDPPSFSAIVGAALVHVPAILTFVALSVFLIGVAPKFANLVWAFLVYTFIVIYMSDLVDLPRRMSEFTPTGLTPALPAEDFEIAPILLLSGIAVVLTVIGLYAYGRRDAESA
jgi:ABC-2 type transport system permease protein